MSKIPITALSGFLGSGKTTLLRRWRLDESLQGAAIVVHDLSDFGVDVELLASENSQPEQGQLVDRVAALHGEHSREDLHSSLEKTLDEIAQLAPLPPHVLCESTGAARPWPLVAALTQDDRFHLRHFVVTVDALNLHRDFSDGQVFTGQVQLPNDAALRYAAEVLAEQIFFSSVIVLTKTDLVPKSVVDAQVQLLQQLHPKATIALSARAGLLLSQLDATAAPSLSELASRAEQFGLSAKVPTAGQIDSVVIRDSRPFHPQRLFEACKSQLSTGLYRTKGFVWLASRPQDVLLWQQSASQISLEPTGLWQAEAVQNRFGKLLPQEVQFLERELSNAHPVFGDRNNELTLIGLPEACSAFATALRRALCTDDEVRAWKKGEPFPDPWPNNEATTG